MTNINATNTNVVDLKLQFTRHATAPHEQIANAVKFIDQVKAMTATGAPLPEEVFKKSDEHHTALHHKSVLYEHAAAYQASGIACEHEMDTYLNNVSSTLEQVNNILGTLTQLKMKYVKIPQ